jgi:hypothetical protein
MKPRRRLPLALGDTDVLTAPESGPRLFLGRLDVPAVRAELARVGVLDALAARGYPLVDVRTLHAEGEHRLSVTPEGDAEMLVDLRMVEGASALEDPLLRALGLDVLSFLAVQWLALQHPRGTFTPDRPRLPGQRHPGLGIGRQLFDLLVGWGSAWGKDALLNYPEYLHNARFYAPPFVFLSAPEQGRFEALGRDLSNVHIAEASAAMEDGRVVDTATGETAAWEPGPMIMPLTDRVRQVLEAPAWRDAAAAAAARSSFRIRGEPAPAPRP